MWTRHFANRAETPESIRAALQILMRSKKFDHAVGLLKAAIRRGSAEPWMYEALALAQEAAGADKEEVKRTLLSAADVVSDSPEAQYRVARLLARHGLKEAAIRLFREASERAPLAIGPYLESLDLAASVGDDRTVRWAATHLLSQGWVDIQEEVYRKARGRVAEVEKRLRSQGRDREADELSHAVREADMRDLVVRVSWQGDADIDLRVVEPLGTVCSSQNRTTPAGGVLVKDGFGKDAGSEQNPAELYVCARGLPGPYEIRLQRVWGNPSAGRVKVEVTQHQGAETERQESFYVSLGSAKPLVVKLEKGRRTQLLAIPQVVAPPSSAAEARLPIQQLRSLAQSESGRKFDGPQQLFQFRTGGGAVAFDPTVTQFFIGAGLSVQAVVSADRRYVRINAFPSFTTLVGEKRFLVSGAAAGGFR